VQFCRILFHRLRLVNPHSPPHSRPIGYIVTDGLRSVSERFDALEIGLLN
jgi:hypothetical protein